MPCIVVSVSAYLGTTRAQFLSVSCLAQDQYHLQLDAARRGDQQTPSHPDTSLVFITLIPFFIIISVSQ